MLIDCGEATQMQLMKFRLGYMKINHIFISHLHADHYIGLIGLLNTMNLNQRKNDLFIFCPKGLDEIIEIQFKLSGIKPAFKIIYVFTSHLGYEKILENDYFEVHTFPLNHRIPVTAFIFREKELKRNIKKNHPLLNSIPIEAFEVLKRGEDFPDTHSGQLFRWEELTVPSPPPRSYAFVTDTLVCPAIIEYIRGVDLLYHEATFAEEDSGVSKESFHCTNSEAAQMAKDAGVKKLLIGHFSTRYKEFQSILEQSRKIFPETYLALEGERFDLAHLENSQ